MLGALALQRARSFFSVDAVLAMGDHGFFARRFMGHGDVQVHRPVCA